MTDPRPLVLLIQLPIPPPGPQPVQGNVPLAAAYLKSFARRRGLESSYRIEILPPPLADALGDQALVEEILRRGPWLVGFTCYLWNITRVLWIAERLRRADPEIGIVLGGPEITADNRWVLEHPAVDCAVIGEGEQTFAELIVDFRSAKVPSFRGAKGNHRHCAIASPYVEGILDVAAGQTMFLETVRGCRYRCKYCYYPKSYDSICYASADRIAASLRHANRQGVGEVFLLDPTLNQRPDFAEFLRLLARENPERRFTYSAELRAEGIDDETAQLLAAANFKEVEVGLQSIEPEAQRRMGRPVNLAAFERGAAAMLAAGIRVRVDLILGLPGDTPDSIRRGLDYLERTRPFSELQIFNLSILPGTAFRAEAESLGLEYQPRPPYYVLRTPTLDVEAMYDLMAEAEERFDVEFDVPPPPDVESLAISLAGEAGQTPPSPPAPLPKGEGRLFSPSPPAPLPKEERSHGCIVDLDSPRAAELPPAGGRTQVFTLWLRAENFTARQEAAADLVRRVLADNPHTTLEVVLEPIGDPASLTPDVLESLLAVCHETLSYLDWYYSLHPARLMGAKRLVVVLPAEAAEREREELEEYAVVVEKSEKLSDEKLSEKSPLPEGEGTCGQPDSRCPPRLRAVNYSVYTLVFSTFPINMMSDPYFQQLFAERIGGANYGKGTEIYKFEKIKRAKRKALAERPALKLIDFGIGENDEMAAPGVRQVMGEEINKPENRGYADNGIPAFKEAVARFMRREFQVNLDPVTEINHCIGTKTALAMLPAAFINPGDVTLMTVPGYPVAGTHTRYYGGQVHRLPLCAENDFLPDLDAIPADVLRRAKLLVLNYPNSPTGKVATPEFYARVIDFAKTNQIVVVQDAAHLMLSYQSRPLSFLQVPGARDVGVEIHSLSKGWNMIGWRMGWVCGHERIVRALADVKDNSDSGQFIAIQKAAVAALDDPAIVRSTREKYERRLKKLVATLRRCGFQCNVPGGTYFLYAPSPKGTADGLQFATAEAASQFLIAEHSVCTVPWDDAGAFLRFSVTYEAADESAEDALMVETEHRLKALKFQF